MAERSIDPLIGAFLSGYLRRLSEQMASVSRGQDMLQATVERQLLLMGQLISQVTAMQTAPQKPSGTTIWAKIIDLSKKAELAHKLYRLLVWSRLVSWPVYVGLGLRWLGWL